MTNNIDKVGGNYHSGKAEDAGYKTESGNHAAGINANDTPSINQNVNQNINHAGSLQSGAAGSSGGMTMTSQSIGGQGAQDGIQGTPSGTQGADAGQGVNQGGASQQSAQGGNLRTGEQAGQSYGERSDNLQSGADRNAPGIGQTGPDGSVPGAGHSQRATGDSQQSSASYASSSPGGSGDLADKLQGGPENQQGSGQGLPTGPGSEQSQRGLNVQGGADLSDADMHDIDDLGSKRMGGSQSREDLDQR